MTALARQSEPDIARDQLKIVVVGHVDHGKSSLIGRLFYDTDSLPNGKYEQIKASSDKRGMPFEWSFLLDALQAERDQGITIDTTQMWFKTAARDYVIIDAPGHKEFLKNMISGAASADAAILLIDAKEGVKEQSRRHGYLLHLLGIRQIAVAVNKMDLVDYSQSRFDEIVDEYSEYLTSVGVTPTVFIPISAREGWNVAHNSSSLRGGEVDAAIQSTKRDASGLPRFARNDEDGSWYTGPTIIDALDQFTATRPLTDLPLRFPIQDVYKFDERRILAGRIETGRLKVGDTLLFSPSNKSAKIASLERWPDGAPNDASAGQSIGLTLNDQLFIERGDVASLVTDAPKLSNLFHARIVWLGQNPLRIGSRYRIKLQTAEYDAEVRAITRVLDTDTLDSESAQQIARHGIGEVTFRLRGLAALDDHAENPKTGRFVIIEDYDVVGGGIVDLADIENQRSRSATVTSQNITVVEQQVTIDQRARMNGHLPGVLWFTGLSGSGKSTLTQELQKRLFARGHQVFVLDGDNVRHGLCADLGFSHEDRSENIRRVGEVAALFAKAGFLVLTAFISPYIEDRRRARAAAPDYFHTIYVKADIATCESRDIKGLYAKARRGEIKHFTGIDDPYEPPIQSDLEIDTRELSIEASVEKLVAYVEEQFIAPLKDGKRPHEYQGEGI